MAEDKKGDSKKDASGGGINTILYYLVIIIPLALIVMSAVFGVDVLKNGNNTGSASSTQSSVTDPYSWFGKESFALRSIVVNKKDAAVRTAPGGSIVGTQDKLETGRLMEGPVEQYGTTWWRIDYPQAPDGWVDVRLVSTKIGLVRTFNIVPLLYSFYKPIGYGLAFCLLALYVWFTLRLKREEGIFEKKKQLRYEQYAEPQRPLAQLIEEKPDVQEIPGFQTEEIMPIRTMEENARWMHIQSLISSYNPSDWRQAIIEADIILEEMLDKMGYDGVTIGDKLKNVEQSDFVTLDKAWSAHRIRNQIAHSGSSFKLTREVAERTIKDFEQVFKEFYYI
jgi:hypothetical protein